MSISLGVFLVIPDLVKSVEKTTNKCKTKGCKNFDKEINTKFCPECGKSITVIKKDGKESYSARDLFLEGDMVDRLYFPDNMGYALEAGKTIAKSNQRIFGPDVRFESSQGGVYPLMDINQQKDIEEFKESHKREIDHILKNGFQIEYNWGVVLNWG